MWNLILDFDSCRETVRELLEFELRYARRMAGVEKCPLSRTVVYTEWGMYCGGLPREEWEKQLETPEGREKLFREAVIPFLEKNFRSSREAISASRAGFLSELHTEYYMDSPELLLTLHFRNKFAPDSPFRHTRELAAGLLSIVEQCMAEHPGIRRVQCASWLNNRREFLALFPPEWLENRTFCLPMEGSAGWWGSFIDCRGRFNRLRAAEFERLGGFTMPNLHCRCRIDALRRHLAGPSSELSAKSGSFCRQKG